MGRKRIEIPRSIIKSRVLTSQILQQENELSEKSRSMFNRVMNAAARMKQLIENLLSFSRVANNQNLFENSNLNKILQDVIQELSEKIQQSGTAIQAGRLPENIMVVPFQFHQLFTNLISNSIKFSKPEQKPEISIRYEFVTNHDEISRELSASPYHHITVSDNGIGFDMEYADKIFRLFHRLNGREYDGTGIGLSIAKKILDNHRGYILAKSELNKGTTFTIFLPGKEAAGESSYNDEIQMSNIS